MKKLGLLLAGLVAAISLGMTAVGPASAAAYPPSSLFSVVVTPNPAPPGGTVVVTFSGCTVGESVQFTLASVSVTAACTAPSGSATAATASASLTVPTAPGTYTVTATGLTSGATATGTLTVAAAAPSSGGLPATGSDSSSTLQIATLAVVVGTGLLLVGFQRRRRHI
jgi:LPXTG-motif cell wall-anchored protein